MLIEGASLPLHLAAELATVEVRTIRQWAATGALDIELLGVIEVVRLDKVQALAGSSGRASPSRRREALRGGLRGDD
jgi:hypothetical protein